MTGRALQALVQAKRAGLTDAATLARSAREARALQAPTADSRQVLPTVALAQAGDFAAAQKLGQAGKVTAPGEQARLAAVLAVPNPEFARTLYDRARRQAKETRLGGLGLEGSEATALLLQAALRLKVRVDIPALRAGLLERKTGGACESPVATASAVTALRLLAGTEGASRETQVCVTLGGFQQIVRVGAPLRLLIPTSGAQPGTKLKLDADGPLAFERELRIRTAGTPPDAASAVVIERRYDRSKVGRDEVVTVPLTLRTSLPSGICASPIPCPVAWKRWMTAPAPFRAGRNLQARPKPCGRTVPSPVTGRCSTWKASPQA